MLIPPLAGLALLLSARVCAAQGIEWNLGPGLEGRHEIVQIGPAPRVALRDYLTGQYRQQCPPHKKNLPEICEKTKALYVASSLPVEGSHPLPPEVTRDLGFIQPGTDYVQNGFVVYLITLPRRVILDSVAVKDTAPSGIQWHPP